MKDEWDIPEPKATFKLGYFGVAMVAASSAWFGYSKWPVWIDTCTTTNPCYWCERENE